MTISATTNRVPYPGNGVTTAFPFPYPFHSQADLVVIETVITTGAQTTKALTTDYLVSGTTDAQGHYPDGGTVTALAAPASTVTWTIYRDPSAVQSTDFVQNDDLPAESLESALDYQTLLNQRTRDMITRSLRQPEGDSANIDYLPAKVTRASKYLAFDSDGDPIATVGTTEENPVSAFMATVLDDATAAAARATLGIPLTTKGDLLSASAADVLARLAVGADGTFLTADSAQTTGLRWAAPALPCQFRLTLTTATPVTTGDVTAATTLYWTPYAGNLVALYDGTRWVLRSTTERSIAVPASTSQMYDVFVYDNSGTPTLELTAWTNDTTRATALTTQDGVLVKTGALTRRYVGSFRTTGVSGQTEDSAAKRYVWNYYNRVIRAMRVTDTTDSWTYTTATWRQANAAAGNQLDFVIGVAEEVVEATAHSMAYNSSAGVQVSVGIGLDATNANSAHLLIGGQTAVVNIRTPLLARYAAIVTAGRHYLAWLEQSEATGATTWIGDGGGSILQSGMIGLIRH